MAKQSLIAGSFLALLSKSLLFIHNKQKQMVDPNLKAAEADAPEVNAPDEATEEAAASQEQAAGSGDLID